MQLQAITPVPSHWTSAEKPAFTLSRDILFGRQVRIMSWNLRNFSVENSKPARLKAIQRVVETHKPDILLFQEINNENSLYTLNKKYLNGEYPNIDYFDRDPKDGNPGLAYMARKDFKVTERISHAEAMVHGRRAFTRDFPEVTYRFNTESGPENFKVINVHAKSIKPPEHPDEKARQRDMRKRQREYTIATQVLQKRLKKDPDARIVLMGDLNMDLLAPTQHDKSLLKKLAESGMIFASPKDATATHVSGRRLDDCLVSPFLVKKIQKPATTREQFSKQWTDTVSDHLPVVIDFETEQTEARFFDYQA